MSGDGSRRRGLSHDERVLWTTVTKAIKPLRARPVAPHEDAEPADAAAKPGKPAPKTAHKTPRAAAPVAPSQKPSPPLAPQLTPQLTQLGRRLRGRVARGKHAIDARLD